MGFWGEGESGGDGVGDVQLKFGPGKAWMMARPRRKSREETQPSATTYLELVSRVSRCQTA